MLTNMFWQLNVAHAICSSFDVEMSTHLSLNVLPRVITFSIRSEIIFFIKHLLMWCIHFIMPIFAVLKNCLSKSAYVRIRLCFGVLQTPQHLAPLWLLPRLVSCVSHSWVCTQRRTVWWVAALWIFSWGQKCHSKCANLKPFCRIYPLSSLTKMHI